MSTRERSIILPLLLAGACSSTTPGPGPGPSGAGLPSVGFLQLKDERVGDLDRVATFGKGSDGKDTDQYGVLLARSAADGKTELLVEDGGKQKLLAGPAYFLTPHAVASGGFRAVCVVEYGMKLRGRGPVGPVYELARDVVPELVCFLNLGDGAAPWAESWSRMQIARGEANGKPHAIWPLIVGAAPSPGGVKAKGAISLFWVRDRLWDAGWMSNAGRDPADKTVERRLTLGLDGQFQLSDLEEFGTYFEAAMFTSASAPRCAATSCGAFWNGYQMLQCPATCASDEACINQGCEKQSCTAKTAAVACKLVDESQGKRCGKAMDGCGGVVDCGGCAANESCGGGGVPGLCGRYKMNEARLRQLYNDTANKLCGSFDDLAGGKLDLSKANVAKNGRECPEGESCKANLCQK